MRGAGLLIESEIAALAATRLPPAWQYSYCRWQMGAGKARHAGQAHQQIFKKAFHLIGRPPESGSKSRPGAVPLKRFSTELEYLLNRFPP